MIDPSFQSVRKLHSLFDFFPSRALTSSECSCSQCSWLESRTHRENNVLRDVFVLTAVGHGCVVGYVK
jgi:hypothetical protein